MKFFIGLFLGILVAGGVAFYLNKAPNPFVDKGFNNNDHAHQLSNSSGPLLLAPGTKMATASAPRAKPQASATNYDFYDVLQGNKDINPKSPAATPPPPVMLIMLQVGAFANQDSANNMKARLALLGYSSRIKQQQQDSQIVNRVLIGPLASMEQAQSLVEQLNNQDIAATIIKLNR